jgi:hypothetical protein
MRRIDEEAYFLIGFFPLFSQDYYSQSDACNGYDNHCIEYQRPETEPEGLRRNRTRGFYEYFERVNKCI